MITKNEFAQIYEDYFDRLYAYVYFRVNDEAISEDITSQAFYKALKNLKTFDSSKGKISTWLYTITSNLIIDHYRKNENTENIDEYENRLYENIDFNENLDLEIDITRINSALKKLSAKTQEIISLRIYKELPYSEIAKIIGIGESGVKMAYLRGIEVLKNSINLILLIILLFT